MTAEKFKFVTEGIVRKELMNLDGSKVTSAGDISINILKSTIDIHLNKHHKFVNRRSLFS